jgi:hypothetical protein
MQDKFVERKFLIFLVRMSARISQEVLVDTSYDDDDSVISKEDRKI